MLLDDLKAQLITAMKSREVTRVETLRFLLSAVRNVAIAKYAAVGEAKLTDSDILDVIKKQVKTHNESVEAFTNAGRTELADREKAQLAILETYLPKQLSDDELRKLLEPIVKQGGDLPAGRQDLGPMMGRAMAVLAGLPAGRQADGGRVAGILKQLLSQ